MKGARLAPWAVGAGCLWASLSLGGPAAALSPAVVSAGGDRSLAFVLTEPATQEAPASGTQAVLTLRLDGEPTERQEIVAIVEGTLVSRVMVSMVPGEGPRSWQAEVFLDAPTAGPGVSGKVAPSGEAGRSDPRQRFHRVDVSFAKLKGMHLTPFLHRSAYLNLDPRPERRIEAKPEPVTTEAAPNPPPPATPVAAAPAPLPGIERESVAPVLDGIVTESDLPLPRPVPRSVDYWQALEQRVTAQFRQRVRAGASSARLPRVQFRLYSDGVARVIALERSSGSPQVDRAGMDSVIDAHPFPPFPEHMAESYVDVHVDFAAPKPVASQRGGKRR
ncbi:MAG: TonB C-terminal domain-containing protein [Nitrospirota bacterium]|nr:TonB C-terminal domain-containing protein [Nitrospirota bacterium]